MNLVKPIHVGPVRIDAPVILAPMTGVTDLPFRRIVKRYGAGLTVSEMIASQAMIRETRQSLQKSLWDPSEEPVSLQLAGCAPYEMAEAAKLNEQRGAAIIDINMGCPVKKVVNGDAGSALMRDLPLAAAIIDATVKAVKVPVTLKMRMGWDHNSLNAPELARVAEDLGDPDDHRPRPHPLPDVQGQRRLELHPQGQGGGVGAGDRQRRHLLDRRCARSAGAVGRRRGDDRPRRLRPAVAAGAGDPCACATAASRPDPSSTSSSRPCSSNMTAMLALYGRMTGVNFARKHIGWYTKGLPGSAEFRNRVNTQDDPGVVVAMLREFYSPWLGAVGRLRQKSASAHRVCFSCNATVLGPQ